MTDMMPLTILICNKVVKISSICRGEMSMEMKDCQYVVRIGARSFSSLPEALSQAGEGDTLVLLCDVECGETLYLDRAVTLCTDGAAPRTIRCTASGAALVLHDGCTVAGSGEEAPLIIDGGSRPRKDALIRLCGKEIALRYVTVQNGHGAVHGGGLFAAAGSTGRMEYCRLTGNRACKGGGGFVEAGADIKLHRCLIHGNHAFEKGGAFFVQGKMLPTGCTVTANTSAPSQGCEMRLAKLPPFSGDKVASADGDGTELAVFKQVPGGDDFSGYAAKLLAAGFSRLREEYIDNNRFSVFCGGGCTLTLMDTPSLQEGTVRLAIDDGPPPCEDLGVGEALCTPLLVQLGTGCDTMQNGAALLVRLCDGRFLVVDGGYTDDAPQLYHTMKALSPTGEVRIALWLLTHTHSDHCEAFLAFWQQPQAQEVTLEAMLMHLPGDEVYAQNIVGGPSDVRWKEKINACLAAIASKPRVIRAHPGQQFRAGDMELTVLYTAELMAPQEIWNFNDTSVVCTLQLRGLTCLLPGDCAVAGTERLTTLYDEALRCHILQASHHGHYNNAPHPLFYEKADPAHVLWCSTWKRFNWQENRAAPANQFLFARQERGETAIWCAGDLVRIFELCDGRLMPLEVKTRLRDEANSDSKSPEAN